MEKSSGTPYQHSTSININISCHLNARTAQHSTAEQKNENDKAKERELIRE